MNIIGNWSTSLCLSTREYWRQNVHGGWATVLALLFVLLWHFFRSRGFFFVSRFGASSVLFSPSTPNCIPSRSPQFGRHRWCVQHQGGPTSNSQVFKSPSSLEFTISFTSITLVRCLPTCTLLRIPTSSSTTTKRTFILIGEIVSDADLKFLIENLEEKISEEKWDNIIDRRNNLLSYRAKCCKPKDGPLKYLSVTVFENCSPEMLKDFYLDSDFRKQWDKTVVENEQLLVDEKNGFEVGRTVKKFPLLTPREYVLAWKLWKGDDGSFYCFIKECEHPLAPRRKRYVRVGIFRSGWRIKGVPGRNACEIKMFHQEDAGLNMEMAKMAFAKGIWSYVCKMDGALRKYYTINHGQFSITPNASTLIRKVPSELDASTWPSTESTSAVTAINGSVSNQERKFIRKPSKKTLANGLILLGGILCLSRGHSSLGAKVAAAYILAKLRKGGNSSSHNNQSLDTDLAASH